MKTTFNRSRVISLLFCSAVLIFFALPGLVRLADVHAQAESNAKKVLTIGLILPLTGPAAFYGEHVKNGALLAYESMSAEAKSHYNLVFEDDQFDARMALTAYQKLRAEKNIDVVVLFGSQSGHSVIPAASRDKVLSLIFTVDPKVTAGRQGAYRLALEADTQAVLLEREFQKHRYKRFALLGTTHEAMLQYTSTMRAEILKNGGEVVYDTEFTKGETDFKAALLAIQQKKADAVVVALLPPSLANFAKQKKQFDLSIPFYGFAQVENVPEIQASHGALDGVMFSGLALDEKFREKFFNRFHDEAGSFAGYSFEFMNQLEEARLAGASSTEGIDRYFASKKSYHGCFGPFVRRDDNSYDIPASLLIIENGKIREASAPGK